MTGCPFLLLFYNILRRFSRYEDSLLFFFLLFCCLGPLGSLPAAFHLGIYQRFSTFVLLLIQTGGLKDTVWPYNEYEGTGTGFSFANYNAHEMLNIIRYAKHIYYDRRREWNKIIDRGLAVDFSWNTSAGKYQEL